MKLLLCVHGYPPELVGGTELAARSLAHALARRGDEVVVVAGTVERATGDEVERRTTTESVDGATSPIRVHRLARPDLYFDHWQKSRSVRVAAAFRELLREERPDLVHVHHWLRLTRDLVALAAAEGIPAIVSLHDAWVSCPLAFRVRPESEAACELPLAAPTCLPCVGQLPPRTPWVPLEMQFMSFAQRTGELLRELRLARALLVPTEGHGERLRAFLGDEAEGIELAALPPAAPPRWSPREPLALPAPGEPLRLGAWGRCSRLKGTDLLFEALDGLEDPAGIELVLAGPEESPGFVDALRRRFPRARVEACGAFDHEALDAHPVTRVHAMVAAGRAPESFGLVLEEARALGLPAILPEHGAFAERAGEETGAVLFAPGDAAALRGVLRALRETPERLAVLRDAVPPPVSEEALALHHRERYAAAVALGPPEGAPEPEWYAERMERFAEEEWDRRLSGSSARELGFAQD